MGIEVRPVTPQQWADVVAIFEGGQGSNGCWCQRFARHTAANNEAALSVEIKTSSVPVGVLAYRDDNPAGWSRVVPRHTLPGVVDNAALRRLLKDDVHGENAAWWISCVVVLAAHRGHGIGVALLRAAAQHAREHGASVVDGHPVDVGRLKARPSPAALFTGTKTMFLAAGFEEIGRTFVSRPVMRKML